MLIVREVGSIKNTIIPFFYKKLKGNKGKQFLEWLEKFGSDSKVPATFKFIFQLYRSGFYDRKQWFYRWTLNN
mgnify:FL=1